VRGPCGVWQRGIWDMAAWSRQRSKGVYYVALRGSELCVEWSAWAMIKGVKEGRMSDGGKDGCSMAAWSEGAGP
jgi:hypothetical protein